MGVDGVEEATLQDIEDLEGRIVGGGEKEMTVGMKGYLVDGTKGKERDKRREMTVKIQFG